MTEAVEAITDQDLIALADRFDPARAMSTLEALCAEEFQGRGLGTQGHDQAVRWLAGHLGDVGLEPVPDTFVVSEVFRLESAASFLVEGPQSSRQLEHRREYAEHPRSARTEAPVKGVAVRWNGTPESEAWTVLDRVPQGRAFDDLVEQVRAAGGVGILTPQDPDGSGFLTKRTVGAGEVRLPVVAVCSDQLAQLVGGVVTAHVPLLRTQATGTNLVATPPGVDLSKAEQPVLITAHHDGVGADPGRHFQCAGDNASGVAVLCEVARVLGGRTPALSRPILFATLDAEEHGALGSRHHARQLVAEGWRPEVLNVDMAGKFNGTVAVELGQDTQPIIAALDRAGRLLHIPLAAAPVASDNRQYAAAGMPAAGIGLGAAHYHSPLDSLDRIDPEALRKAGRLVLATVAQLATRRQPAPQDNQNIGKE